MGIAKKKRGRPKKKPGGVFDPGSKERIIAAAIRIFARKGYDGATIQEIVNAANANLSMISYHFGGKEALYVACVQIAGESGLEAAQRLLTTPKTREEFLLRMKLFIEELVDFHVKNWDLAEIIRRESLNPLPALKPLFEKSFYDVYRNFETYFVTGQKLGYVRKGIQIPYFAMFYFNAFIGICRTDACSMAVLGKTMLDPKYREGILKAMTDDMIEGIFTAPGHRKS
jgi:AcrR family transcriptional regulator